MGELLAVVALVTSPFWILMVLNAGRGRSRVQALSGTVADLARALGLQAKKEGADTVIAGEYDAVPIEITATNLETSPRLIIRIPLPTSLKAINFRAREGHRGPRFETGDRNFDQTVAADGDPMWLAAILDAPTRAAIASLVLSLSARTEGGSLVAEVPIMLEEEGAADPAAVPTDGVTIGGSIAAPSQQPPPEPPPEGVTVTLDSAKKPPPPGPAGYLLGCVERVLVVARAMLAQTMVKIERLVQISRDESAPGVRIGAIKGLMLMGRPERVVGLCTDQDAVVRLYAAAQVGDHGLAAVEGLLAEIPGPGLPVDPRFPAERTVDALKSWRPVKDTARLRPLLARFCRSADPSVRHAALHAVARLQVPEPLSLFVALPDLPEDRLQLIAALTVVGDPGGEGLLWRLLAAPEEAVRVKAVEALQTLGTRQSVDVLSRYAQGQLPVARLRPDGTVELDPEGRPEGRPEGKPEGKPDGKPDGKPAERPAPISANLQRLARDAALMLQRRLEGGAPEKPAPEKPAPVTPVAPPAPANPDGVGVSGVQPRPRIEPGPLPPRPPRTSAG